MEVVVATGLLELQVVQSSSQITTNKPTPSFLQAGCPSCRQTNSVKALTGKISHSVDLLTPSSPGGLPTLSLTTNSSWLPWRTVAMPLISPLMPVPQGSVSIKNSITLLNNVSEWKLTATGSIWSYKTCRAPVKSSPPTPSFLQAGFPVAQPAGLGFRWLGNSLQEGSLDNWNRHHSWYAWYYCPCCRSGWQCRLPVGE